MGTTQIRAIVGGCEMTAQTWLVVAAIAILVLYVLLVAETD